MLKIYGVPISVHTRKVLVAARLKGLAIELVPVVPVIPGNPPPNWRQLSPTGRIPVLQDDDFVLADSAAICAYLERRQPAPSIYPAGDRPHALALWFEQYAGGTVFRDVVHPLFHQAFVNPNVHGIPTDPTAVDAVLTRAMPEVYGYLDVAAGDDGFLAGPQLSVADVAVVSNLVTVQYIGYALERGRYPRLAALFDRVIRIPAMAQVLQAEQPVVQQMGLSSAFLHAVLQ
jgi:glutathione S-transferase